MSTSTQPVKVREPRPLSPAAASAATLVPAPVPVYWGDRLVFWFWIACFGLMVLMNLIDTVVGILTH